VGTIEIPGDERGILTGMLDWDRAVVENKARGLDRDGATRIATPSGVTVLGLVTHLAYVEGRWFRHHLAGEDLPSDPGEAYAPDPGLTVEDAIAAYAEACATSRAITAELDLDTLTAVPQKHVGLVTLRYVLAHMIDETARHLGHMDVLREMTDGQVGDG
jgi:uncharacterized damage-inducible protein DinB